MNTILKFRWDAVTGAEGYRIYKSLGSQDYIFAKQFIVTDVKGTEAQIVCNLEYGIWNFVVVAYDELGEGSTSNVEIVVISPIQPKPKLRAPESFFRVG